MKKVLLLVLIPALVLALAGCGPVMPIENDPPAALPESCMRYYDLAQAAPDAAQDAPRAADAKKGDPRSFSVWHNGQYQNLAAGGGDGVYLKDIEDGRAVLSSGEMLWNGQRYDCAVLTVDSGYVPNLSPNENGGILRLELQGDCWTDGGTAEDIGCFAGFNTVVLSGSGTLRMECGLSAGGGTLPLPALILEGPALTCGTIGLEANAGAEDVPQLLVRAGSLEAEALLLSGDLCLTGGTVKTDLVADAPYAVFRGGSFTTAAWGGADPTILLSGGEAACTSWLPEGAVIELGAGTLSAPGLSYMEKLHTYAGGVGIDLPSPPEA